MTNQTRFKVSYNEPKVPTPNPPKKRPTSCGCWVLLIIPVFLIVGILIGINKFEDHPENRSCKTQMNDSLRAVEFDEYVPSGCGIALFSLEGGIINGINYSGRFILIIPGKGQNVSGTLNKGTYGIDDLSTIRKDYCEMPSDEYQEMIQAGVNIFVPENWLCS